MFASVGHSPKTPLSTTRPRCLKPPKNRCTPPPTSRTLFQPFDSTPWRIPRVGKLERTSSRLVCRADLGDALVGLGLFFSPSAVFALYALVIGKGDFGQGLSVALTQISRGYFQPNLGGDKVPVCDGELKDLVAADEPLFCFLYTW